MRSVKEVAVLKVVPTDLRGKYKIGQHWIPKYRLHMARNIVEREREADAKRILKIMGIEMTEEGGLKVVKEPIM
jgi:hypothetical protein